MQWRIQLQMLQQSCSRVALHGTATRMCTPSYVCIHNIRIKQVLHVCLELACVHEHFFSLTATFKREREAWGGRRRHLLIHVSSPTQLTALQVFCCQWSWTMMRRDHPLMEKNSISVSGLIWILAFSSAFVAWLQRGALKQRPHSTSAQKGQFTDSWPKMCQLLPTQVPPFTLTLWQRTSSLS